MFGVLKKIFGTAQTRSVKKYRQIVQQINEIEQSLQSLDDTALKAKTVEFRERIAKGETLDQLLPEAYAVVKNTCRRLMGKEVHVSGYDQQWDMIPYDVQLIGAIAMHKGTIAEMETGEGKTLTAILPLYLNALSGKSVHLVTVNDYLAKRDCEWVGSILRWHGLTTAALTNDVPTEKRAEVYTSDVVYGTASEFGFDYLRDNSMAMGTSLQVQRGFYYAIIDEVDSILIDEARTPLIISGPSPVSRQMYDKLQGGAAHLVKKQRDLCNKLATDAKKTLDSTPEGDKKANETRQEAFRKLWLVSKGTPRNKILMRCREEPDMRAAIDKWDLYYYSDHNKQERADELATLFLVVDEKANEFEQTDKGIAEWATWSGNEDTTSDFVMMDISHEYLTIDENSALSDKEKIERKLAIQEEDAKRKERVHNLRQLLRAHLLMERDVDYIIQEQKIVIIDENTGRPQPGRRFSDGLHQAIEAKETVPIQKETQTYATITLQNFFRMYDKLAGMTGTAITEANELKQIYKLDVLEIPTHRPCQRKDLNDEIYMTEREKYHAILNKVKELHAEGRPILIGTESVDISEKLSRIFRQNKLPHTILNAKHNEREAEIIAHAGQSKAITISTNMAGRGTDIKLGEGVTDLGGLFVMGTTRHQSRRTDRQLRGRCARQGDPGTSLFYISFEDSLMRLFASPRLTGIIQKIRPPEGEPISASILNKSIETAQKRVEQRNYTIRKHTLEYDDVMNKQRKELYTFRNEVLQTDNVKALAEELLGDACYFTADLFFPGRKRSTGWDSEGFRQSLMEQFPVSFEEGCFEENLNDREAIETLAEEKILSAFANKHQAESSKVERMPNQPPEGYSPVDEALRNIMIRKVDQLWQEHLLTMDHLRSDVSLRTVGQRDPLIEFKQEAFALFDKFSRTLRQEISQCLFRFELVTQEHPTMSQLADQLQMETNRSLTDNSGTNGAPAPQPLRAEPSAGRNEPCPCGSGKKYKKCCGQLTAPSEKAPA